MPKPEIFSDGWLSESSMDEAAEDLLDWDPHCDTACVDYTALRSLLRKTAADALRWAAVDAEAVYARDGSRGALNCALRTHTKLDEVSGADSCS